MLVRPSRAPRTRSPEAALAASQRKWFNIGILANRKVGDEPTFLFVFKGSYMPVLQDSALLDRITGYGEAAASGTEIEVLEVQLRGSGKSRLLRVFIDKKGGVTHGDCELISERMGKLLDEQDAIPGDSYTLEVSSPGAERKLSKARDFERVVGQQIRVVVREPKDGETASDAKSPGAKTWEGKLQGLENETLALEAEPGRIVQIPLAQVQKANLKFKW